MDGVEHVAQLALALLEELALRGLSLRVLGHAEEEEDLLAQQQVGRLQGLGRGLVAHDAGERHVERAVAQVPAHKGERAHCCGTGGRLERPGESKVEQQAKSD